jgi:glycerol-3-phosphate dehydrogenase (NAD(P)+)
MANILILGAGVMGSAFSILLADAGHNVRLVGTHLDRGWIDGIRTTGIHPKLKTMLPDTVVPLTHDQLGEALHDNIDLIVLGVSSAGVDWAIRQLGHSLRKPEPILMLTKGLAVRNNTLCILPNIVRDGLADYGMKSVPVSAVGGPCIAWELVARRDSSVVIAYSDTKLLNWIISIVTTPYYHACPNPDIIGVEVCAALKNFYTLAIGYPAGLLEKQGKADNGAHMHNLAAGLFTQTLAEMSYIVGFMGGTAASVYGLAGTGDLYVTCQAGRNSRMGHLLGTGLRYSEVKAHYMAEETVEGAELALAIGPTLKNLLDQEKLHQAALPLAAAIIDTVCHDLPMRIPWTKFYSSPK